MALGQSSSALSLGTIFQPDWGDMRDVRYRIKYVPDDQLPKGHDWMLCRWGDATVLFLRRSMVILSDAKRAKILEDAWEGCRMIEMSPREDFIPIPA